MTLKLKSSAVFKAGLSKWVLTNQLGVKKLKKSKIRILGF